MEDFAAYLCPTDFLDFDQNCFDDFLKDVNCSNSKKDNAVQLYYKVRDGFLYDPYHLDISQNGLKASSVLQKKRAWCVEKATLLAACARKLGIPSRLGYAIVKNHIGVERLLLYLKRPEIVFHGYVELYVDNKWVQCTPAFDKKVCRISKVEPLNWDGSSNSLFQEYSQGKKFMEYVHYYGVFSDVPDQLMQSEMKKYYPHLFEFTNNSNFFSFKFN